ncbi:hypothetical protein [Nostoc sp.]|uniref:hypothetical protein n=1 Tax=Nostoc sp. TaxID=1180 RepID=UPI002FF54975
MLNPSVLDFSLQATIYLEDKKAELLNRFKSSVETSTSVNLYCWYIPFFALKDKIVFRRFLEALDWAIHVIQSSRYNPIIIIVFKIASV